MASASSWSRFPPITLSVVTRDRLHRRDDDRYADEGVRIAAATGGEIHFGPLTLLTAFFLRAWFSDAILGHGVGLSAEILLQDLTEHRLAGSGLHEQRDLRAQLQRVDFAEDLLRGAAGQAGEDGDAFDQPCAENRMGQVSPGLVQ
jgi:hypothetical protein